MVDYEMGKLAEELIEKRFADKIKRYEVKEQEALSLIKSLEGENDRLKRGKVYLTYSPSNIAFSYCNYDPYTYTYTYVGIDKITEALRATKAALKESERKLRVLISDFNNLPWYKKISCDLKELEDGK